MKLRVTPVCKRKGEHKTQKCRLTHQSTEQWPAAAFLPSYLTKTATPSDVTATCATDPLDVAGELLLQLLLLLERHESCPALHPLLLLCELPASMSSRVSVSHGITKRCCLSWLTNSALECETKCGGRGGGVAGSQPMSTIVHRSPNKLRRSNSILTYMVSAVMISCSS